jgi:hypothetical protein
MDPVDYTWTGLILIFLNFIKFFRILELFNLAAGAAQQHIISTITAHRHSQNRRSQNICAPYTKIVWAGRYIFAR